MPKIFLDTNIVYLDIEVGDIEKIRLKFDRIEVWRSINNIDPYVEITAEEDTYASIIGTVDGPWNLSGTSLIIALNDAPPIEIEFSEVSIDLLSLITKINNIVPKIALQAGPNINKLKIISNIKGLLSGLQLSGTATTVLGLSTNRVVGSAHRIELLEPTTKYRFWDIDGAPEYYYKIRFRNSLNGAVSSFSHIIRATPLQNLDDNQLVTASITLTDAKGMPIEGRRIIIVPMIIKQITGNSLLSTQDKIIIKTDQFGFASTKLAKGITVRVFFEGTGFEREIIVPNIDFDILEAATLVPDPLNIINPPPMAIRTS